MATIISSKTTGGGGASITGDTSGILQLASADGTTAVTIDASQNVTFAQPLTLTTPALGTPASGNLANCTGVANTAKAWVNWTGGGTTINASFNVTSITRSATGNYTVNFTSALADNKYAVALSFSNAGSIGGVTASIGLAGPNLNSNNYTAANIATTSCQFLVGLGSNSLPYDPTGFCSAIFIR